MSVNSLHQFIRTSEAWYADTALEPGIQDEVQIYMQDEHEGLIGEIMLRWYDVGDSYGPALRLECFSDSFAALPVLAPVLERLGRPMGYSSPRMTAGDVCSVLLDFGFVDVTERERSKAHDYP